MQDDAKHGTVSKPTPISPSRGRTAIVVDDDPATQKLMIRSLEQIHVAARGFPDGESALEHLKTTRTLPDVVAIDLQLPRMSGAELAHAIRQDPRLAPIPLILTTARAHLQDEAAAIELGAEFLQKPFRVRDYLATLETALDKGGERALVLIVDDDAAIRDALAGIIADEGFGTMTAADGREALELIASGKAKPALVVLDLMMPRMDGIEMAYRLRSDPALAGTPLLLFSANDHVAALAREVGAVAHVKKPVDLDVLVGMIGNAITTARAPTT